jgi:hypothetical protein
LYLAFPTGRKILMGKMAAVLSEAFPDARCVAAPIALARYTALNNISRKSIDVRVAHHFVVQAGLIVRSRAVRRHRPHPRAPNWRLLARIWMRRE